MSQSPFLLLLRVHNFLSDTSSLLLAMAMEEVEDMVFTKFRDCCRHVQRLDVFDSFLNMSCKVNDRGHPIWWNLCERGGESPKPWVNISWMPKGLQVKLIGIFREVKASLLEGKIGGEDHLVRLELSPVSHDDEQEVVDGVADPLTAFACSCPDQTFASSDPFYKALHGVDLDQIALMIAQKDLSLQLRVNGRASIIFSPDLQSVSLHSRREESFHYCKSLPNLLWRLGSNECGLRMEAPSEGDGHGMVLVVGGRLLLSGGVLDVDRIIAIDAMQVTADSEWVQIAAVIYGKWQSPMCEQSSSVCGCDGATDIYRFDDSNQSPNESGGDGDQRFIPNHDHKSQAFVVFMVSWASWVKVTDYVELDELLEADQIPTTTMWGSSSVLFLAGSSGLLGCLHDDTRARQRRWQWSLLAAEHAGKGSVSHRIDSTIIHVSYQPRRRILFSLDNFGFVCAWRQDVNPLPWGSLFCLEAGPFLFPGDSRILKMWLSPDGEHLFGAVYDRLVLLKFAVGSDCRPGEFAEEALLDVVENVSCKYEVLCQKDSVVFWRVLNKASGYDSDEEQGVVVKRWSLTDTWFHNLRLRHASRAEPMNNFQLSTEIDHNSRTIRNKSLPAASASVAYRHRGQEKLRVYPHVMRVNLCPLLRSNKHHHPAATILLPSDADLQVVESKHMESVVYFLSFMRKHFVHDRSLLFCRSRTLLAVLCTSFLPLPLAMLASIVDAPLDDVRMLIEDDLADLIAVSRDQKALVCFSDVFAPASRWLCSLALDRMGGEFWIDPSVGHNLICALYLKLCGNKSVAVDHVWQSYLQAHGSLHLRQCSRRLRDVTDQVRKLDETANIRGTLPPQVGYVSGLQEIYARRVGLGGVLPRELGLLKHLRVLSMGNNRLSGQLPQSLGQLRHLQRIVLHQNNLCGSVPTALGELGCIVNLAGNPRLEYGPEVPQSEKDALIDIFRCTNGSKWTVKTNWSTSALVCTWYKVGVLSSHVHSLVMSSNCMEGHLPESIGQLSRLRMIELATMPGLSGCLPKGICRLTSLRRLCICRCDLKGVIPDEIGFLVGLEELQLFGNRLSGSIPRSLGCLVNLRLLSLGEYTGGNDFSAEPLPSCLANLKALEALFLANCNLRGPLPSWLGELRELRQLDLQRNMLTGPIPSCIGNLQQLLYLNFKDNQGLCGRLPLTEICSLTKLNRLSLVHCSFLEKEAANNRLRASLPRCKIWI